MQGSRRTRWHSKRRMLVITADLTTHFYSPVCFISSFCIFSCFSGKFTWWYSLDFICGSCVTKSWEPLMKKQTHKGQTSRVMLFSAWYDFIWPSMYSKFYLSHSKVIGNKKKKHNVASFNYRYSKDQRLIFFTQWWQKGLDFLYKAFAAACFIITEKHSGCTFFSVALSGGGHVGK